MEEQCEILKEETQKKGKNPNRLRGQARLLGKGKSRMEFLKGLKSFFSADISSDYYFFLI